MRQVLTGTRTCPGCGSTLLIEDLCRSGPHYGRERCGACRRHIRWIPRPAEGSGSPPAELLELASRAPRRLAHLRGGNDSQRALAVRCRVSLLAAALERKDRDRALIVRTTADALWFLAEAKRPYDSLRWPRPDQLDQGEQS
ncbi:hypothetical protein [Singulisphaera sp. PoT]|uniref:hypothetical protein n=1 Tax=Singulisphaera sp. PoT TaxID=3411797 RepID=UPI003BF5897C